MEAQKDYDASWSSVTNWTIACGSLDKSVTFESSLAPIPDNNNGGNEDGANQVESARKSPLILCPTSPDASPCEITITFEQKHEVRQVYVRSTARVFEIYYAPSLQSINEYLCTVRCGIATRDEEVLQTMRIEEAALTHPKGADKRLDVKRTSNESNLSTTEDDWVEVKAHDTSVVCNGTVPSFFNRRTQDLYEATAEITDADPCTSITLRLLSLQNKGCLFVDEVYVFADPIDLDESENQSDPMGNSGGSTLMAMLAPTLLQLSKTTVLRQIQNEHTFDTQEKEKTKKSGSNMVEPLIFANRIQGGKSSSSDQQQVKLQEAVEEPAKAAHHEVPTHVSDREIKPDQLHIHVESVLDQLVSRVSRVEDLLLSFEEKMLKPISSLDARLQRVEQQLEEIGRKGQNPGLPCCTRFYAPEFSCCDSDPHSSGNIGKDPVSFEKDFSSTSPNGMDHSVNSTQPFPSLVVTAPDFPSADDEGEEDHALVTNSPKGKPKNALAIDDALASALASFLSSTSMERQKYIQALVVKAPDFSNEEDGSSDSEALPKLEVEITSPPSSCTAEANMMGCVKDLASPSSECLLESAGEVICSPNDKHLKREAVEDVEEQCKPQEEGEDDSQVRDIDCKVALVRHEMEEEDIGNGEASKKSNEFLILEEAENLSQFPEAQDYDGSDTTQEGVVENCELKVEAVKEGSSEGILQNVPKFPHAASLVDFETSILDVKFISEKNSNMKFSLEALLSDMSVAEYEDPCTEETNGGFQISELSDLIPILAEEETGSATGSYCIPMDENFYSISNVPLNMENENLEDYHACNNQVLASASLI
ncbi:hypothetical protein SLEP1_g36655 [Rubroshorea leprosula]|uniref:Uncharacterized protein n=1 Tax=Rubroshorea leprosula TaxID=152421 RepID=A0AAV5KSD9_9ROSI|nr:hypothetical protein SLEP1_g36655 [Rubroshorea leprosula]